jgi:hypothetical protein
MRFLVVLLALATAGCSLVFPPSNHTHGDAGAQRDGGRDGGSIGNDGGPPADGGPDGGRDGGLDGGRDGGLDAGPDAGPDGGSDAGPPGPGPNVWPTCGDGTTQSTGAVDLRGDPVVLSDAVYGMLFGESRVAADGEAAIRSDEVVPTPTGTRFVDVALAVDPAGDALLAAALDDGRLHVYPLDTDMPALGAPLPVTWASGDAPERIDRIAMRTVEGQTLLGVFAESTESPSTRAWRCYVDRGAVDCGERFEAAGMTIEQVAVARTSSGVPDVSFLGTHLHPMDGERLAVFRPGASGATISLTRDSPIRPRTSGTGGGAIFAVGRSGGPTALVVAGMGLIYAPIGPTTSEGVGAMAALAPADFLTLRALNFVGPRRTRIEARPAQCDTSACRCPAGGSSCEGSSAPFGSLEVSGRAALMLEAEAAGSGALAFAALGEDATASTGTDVSLYAFDPTGAPVPVSTMGAGGVLLASGRRSGVVGRMVPHVGLRGTVVSRGLGVDVISVALVDLSVGGGPATRSLYYSVLRVCGER